MKNFIYLLISLIIALTACNSAQQYLKQGDFDMASKVAAQKLMKNKNKKKTLEVLIEAYPKALAQDFDKIKYLHQEGRADRWEEIFLTYDNMKTRQTIVEYSYPLYLNGNQVKFDHYDFDQQILEAKNKAADYFYQHAKVLMNNNTKQDYRQAFQEFLKVQTYSASYLDADQLMDKCYQLGQAHLLLIAVNNTPFKLRNDFMVNLINFNPGDLSSFWHVYYTTDVRKGVYDGLIYINLNKIDVSPNGSTTREYTESIEITDGWEYKVDAQGNQVKDTAGNPIKIPKKKVVSCKIVETRQFKQAHLEGAIVYVDGQSKQILRTIPVAADNIFENFYSVADGDQRALKNETKEKLSHKRLSYPLDIDLIYGTNETLKGVIFNALRDNKGYVEGSF